MGTWYLPVPWHWAKFTWLCCVSSALNLPEPLKAFSPFPARVIQAEGSPFLCCSLCLGRGVCRGPILFRLLQPSPEHRWVSVCSSNSVLRIAQHVLCASWEPSGSLLGLQVGKGEHYRDKQQHNSVLGLGVEAISHTFERKQSQGIKNIHSFFFFFSSFFIKSTIKTDHVKQKWPYQNLWITCILPLEPSQLPLEKILVYFVVNVRDMQSARSCYDSKNTARGCHKWGNHRESKLFNFKD